MRLIKMFGLAAITAVAAMAFVGATSAMAESTLLCETDNEACTSPSALHFLSVSLNASTGKYEDAKAVLVTSAATVECNALISTTKRETAALVTNGSVTFAATITYTNCGACTVTVVKNGTVSVLRLGTELGDVTANGFVVNVNCLFGSLNCDYDATGLVGHGLGGLTLAADAGEKGHVTYVKAKVNAKEKLGGFIGCPEVAELTALFQSLTKLYIKS